MYKLNSRPFLLASALFVGMTGFAQDNLINGLKANASDKSKDAFKFTEVINHQNTPIKNQGSSGTCWSYSGNSFIESEMIRMGKKPVEISQIFTARNSILKKQNRTFVCTVVLP